MCLICIEFNKGKMTIDEGFRNLTEMEPSLTKEHVSEVTVMLNNAGIDELIKDFNMEDLSDLEFNFEYDGDYRDNPWYDSGLSI